MQEQDLTLVGLTEDRQSWSWSVTRVRSSPSPADAKLRAALRGRPRPTRPVGDHHGQRPAAPRHPGTDPRRRVARERGRRGRRPPSTRSWATPPRCSPSAPTSPTAPSGASVRRKAGEGPARLLGDAVAERLRARNVDPDTVEWDAWRREDGRWTLVADYRAGESSRGTRSSSSTRPAATWSPRTTRPAGWSASSPPPRAAQPRAGAAARAGSPRCAATTSCRWARTRSSWSPTPAGHRPASAPTHGRVAQTGLPRWDARPPRPTTVDRVQRGRDRGAGGSQRRRPSCPPPTRPPGDADWIATQASDRPAPRRPQPSRPTAAPERGAGGRDEPPASRSTAEAGAQGPSRLGAELGRDHVRRRQAGVTRISTAHLDTVVTSQ